MKKTLKFCIAALLPVMLMAGCSDKENNTTSGEAGSDASSVAEPASVSATEFNAGNFTVSVPEGWKEFPQTDMWADDPSTIDPDSLSICKGATEDWETLIKPSIDIVHYGTEESMTIPSSEWYDNTNDLEPMTIGDKTWNGFTAESMETPMAILWTGEEGEHQYQVTLWLKMSDSSINISDADVQTIIGSIKP